MFSCAANELWGLQTLPFWAHGMRTFDQMSSKVPFTFNILYLCLTCLKMPRLFKRTEEINE